MMGNFMRMMTYDRAANKRAAIGALKFDGGAEDSNEPITLNWFKLDDGVMGGQSETSHNFSVDDGYLDFSGTINTNGGGFCSIRAKIDDYGLPPNTSAVRIKYNGDGKTYKFLLSDGTRGFSTASWQHDIPTTTKDDEQHQEQVLDISFEELKASMGPRPAPSHLRFDSSTVREMGFMLSLKLSDGSPNPIETFGQGIFPFSLKIHSIEPIITKQQEDR